MTDIDQKQSIDNHNKTIQVIERQKLHIDFEQYDNKIQHYEQLYQQEISRFECQLFQMNCYD